MAGLAAVGVLAFLARLLPALHGGGLGGLDNYDDGVYFAGAEALVAGRLPYRDFVLLHPPGILLVLAPFAALARVVSDRRAFELARLAFMGLGALDAILTAVVAGRSRVGGRMALAAGLVAGLLYAFWPPAIDAETTTLLTPLSTLGVLAALALLYRRPAGPRHEVLAGAALGAAAAVKIWGVVPLVVVVVWRLAVAGRRPALRVALGAVAAASLICLPFLLTARGAMVRMVVLDQLGRGETSDGPAARLAGMLGVARFGGGPRPPLWLLVAAVAVVGVSAVAGAVIDRAWLPVALLVAIMALLLAAPSYFAHYAAYVAAPLLVLAGTGCAAVTALAAARIPRPRDRRRAPAGALAVAALPLAVLAVVVAGTHRGTVFPAARLGRAAAGSRCVTSDSPVGLVLMDVMSRDLAGGCRVWVDVSGLTYDRDAARTPSGGTLARHLNRAWNRDLLGYLVSGDATVLVRPAADGLDATGRRTLAALPVLARAHGYALLRVPHP